MGERVTAGMDAKFDTELITQVRTALDASVADLDATTLVHLQQARRNALAALPGGLPWVPPRWVPAGAIVATMVIAIGAWQHVVLPPMPAGGDPVEALAAQDVDLLENLDFVAWLVVDEDADAKG